MYQLSHTVEPKNPLTTPISISEATCAVLMMCSVPNLTISSLSDVPAHSSSDESPNGSTIWDERWFESPEISMPWPASIFLMPLAYCGSVGRAIGVEVVRAAPGCELERLVAEIGGVLRDLLKRFVVEENREQSHLHGARPSRDRGGLRGHPCAASYSSASSGGPIGRGLVAMLRLCMASSISCGMSIGRGIEAPGAQRRRQLAVEAERAHRLHPAPRRVAPREAADVLAERFGDLAELLLAGRPDEVEPGRQEDRVGDAVRHAVVRGHGRRGGVHDRVRVHVERDARHAARERDLGDRVRIALVHGLAQVLRRSCGSRGC